MHGGINLEKLLIIEIESIRESMVNVALKKGLSAKETLALSQKLDSLMNQFAASGGPNGVNSRIKHSQDTVQ